MDGQRLLEYGFELLKHGLLKGEALDNHLLLYNHMFGLHSPVVHVRSEAYRNRQVMVDEAIAENARIVEEDRERREMRDAQIDQLKESVDGLSVENANMPEVLKKVAEVLSEKGKFVDIEDELKDEPVHGPTNDEIEKEKRFAQVEAGLSAGMEEMDSQVAEMNERDKKELTEVFFKHVSNILKLQKFESDRNDLLEKVKEKFEDSESRFFGSDGVIKEDWLKDDAVDEFALYFDVYYTVFQAYVDFYGSPPENFDRKTDQGFSIDQKVEDVDKVRGIFFKYIENHFVLYSFVNKYDGYKNQILEAISKAYAANEYGILLKGYEGQYIVSPHLVYEREILEDEIRMIALQAVDDTHSKLYFMDLAKETKAAIQEKLVDAEHDRLKMKEVASALSEIDPEYYPNMQERYLIELDNISKSIEEIKEDLKDKEVRYECDKNDFRDLQRCVKWLLHMFNNNIEVPNSLE